MKIRYLLIPLLVVLLANNALAFKQKKFGIGVIAGDVEGITGKYMMKNSRAIAVGIGWTNKEYHIYGDYLFYKWDFIKVPEGKLPLYFGGGVRYITSREGDGGNDDNNDDKLGIRIPVGLEYIFWKSSLGAFVEFVPVLSLTPDTKLEFESGIGIRYFF